MAPQALLVSPAEDPTVLILPADTLPPDLLAVERYMATQPAGLVPGATFTSPADAAVAAAAAVSSTSPYAWPGAPPVQGDNLLNGSYTSGVNAALVLVILGAAGARIHLYSILCRCSAGASFLTVQDGTAFLIPAGPPAFIPVAAALTQVVWPVALTIRENNSCTITLAAAGVGNTTTMVVQADRF